MPKNDLQTAFEAFYHQLKNNRYSQEFQPFFDAVKRVDDSMSAMHRRDRYGRIPLLKAEDRERLMALHEAMGAEAEKLIASGKVPNKHLDALKKIAALGAANYRHLRAYDPNEPRSLPELLEDVRTRTLDIRFTEQEKTVGSVQNSRQPLSFLDDDGREIAGVFTPKKVMNFWERWDRSFKEEAKRLGYDAEDQVRNLMSLLDGKQGAKALGLAENATRAEKIAALHMKLLTAPDRDAGIYQFLSDLYSTPGRPMTPEDAKNTFQGFKNAFYDTVAKDGSVLLNNHLMAQIPDGARVDNRNAAMSAVAELLNVPNLVAKSVPMKVLTKDEDGEDVEVEGTFMQTAKGTVVDNLRDEERVFGQNSLMQLDGKAMKSIADLQVLDFICGNTDRHGGNVAYQFDPVTKKLIGVQGFDNDNAFGLVMPKYDGSNQAHLTSPENMLVMSQSMYETLQKITPEMLKFSLRGFGLSEEELDAAAKRMLIVKEKAEKDLEFSRKQNEKKGKEAQKPDPEAKRRLRVLRDEDFKDLKWNKLERVIEYNWFKNGKPIKTNYRANFFTRAYHMVMQIPKLVMKKTNQYRELKSRIPLGAKNRANPASVYHELRDVTELDEELGRRTDGGRTSTNYKKMEKAVKNYREYQENLKRRLRNASPFLNQLKRGDLLKDWQKQGKPLDDEVFRRVHEGVITAEDLQEMQRLGQAMRDSARTYLIGKGILPEKPGQKPKRQIDDYSPYTRERIDIAESVLLFGQKRSVLRDEEIELSSRNERRHVLENENRLKGDLLQTEGPENPEPEKRTQVQL